MQRNSLVINKKKLSFIDEGNPNGPVILLGHCYMWNANMWETQIRQLTQKGFRCIAPDLWGHGDSDPVTEKKYSIESLASDYKLLLDALKISSITMMGISVGGMWGTRLALDNPGLVNSLVIIDTHVGSEPENSRARFFGLMDELLSFQHFTPEHAKIALPFFFSQEALQRNENYVSQFQTNLLIMPRSNINTIASIGYGIFGRNSMLDELPTLSSLPSLVIVGEKDITRPISEAQEMAKLLKSRCVIIKDSGHVPHVEQPEQFTKILCDFLASVYAKA